MFGDGIPLALQVKLTEEPSLADTTLGGIIVEFEESKTRGSEKQNLSVKEGTTLTTVCYKKLHEWEGCIASYSYLNLSRTIITWRQN